MGPLKSQSAVLAAGVASLLLATPAFGDSPPPIPPTPSIAQYIETIPTSSGSVGTQAGKQQTGPLLQSIRTQLDAVATSSVYGAPQSQLTPTGGGQSKDALSAAVSAVSDSGDSHVFWLLAALMVVTATMVWATARRQRA